MGEGAVCVREEALMKEEVSHKKSRATLLRDARLFLFRMSLKSWPKHRKKATA